MQSVRSADKMFTSVVKCLSKNSSFKFTFSSYSWHGYSLFTSAASDISSSGDCIVSSGLLYGVHKV